MISSFFLRQFSVHRPHEEVEFSLVLDLEDNKNQFYCLRVEH